jgi:hypothetical protein
MAPYPYLKRYVHINCYRPAVSSKGRSPFLVEYPVLIGLVPKPLSSGVVTSQKPIPPPAYYDRLLPYLLGTATWPVRCGVQTIGWKPINPASGCGGALGVALELEVL